MQPRRAEGVLSDPFVVAWIHNIQRVRVYNDLIDSGEIGQISGRWSLFSNDTYLNPWNYDHW